MATKEALMILRQARVGDVDAQLAAAKLYLKGDVGIRQDPYTAFYWLRAAAAQGSAEARQLIGNAIPESSVKQPESVAHYYESAAQSGSANAHLALSDWLLAGRIPGGEQTRAYDLLHHAARSGDRRAQLRLAMLLKSGDFGKGREGEALQWLEMAAQLGSRAAALALSDWHWERNDPAALKWIENVGDSADPEHLYRRGILLLGIGEAEAAARLLQEAAQLEHPGAQLQYALLHSATVERRYTGVPHSLKKAAFWLEKASRAGNAQASFELYRLFGRREFSLQDKAMAQRYLQTAAEQGHAHAQFLLGHRCLRDKVTHNADVAAAKWFLRASKQQHAEARATLRVLYSRQESVFPASGMEPARLIRLIARSRIALATRLELAATFGLNIQEMLLFVPESGDHGECVVLDIRSFLPRAKRRVLVVQSESERALLDRARRFISAADPHPTDVRGSYLQRKLDFEHTLTLLGARAV